MSIKEHILKNVNNKKYLEIMPDFKEKKTQAFTTLSLTLIAISIFGIFAISPTLTTITDLQKQVSDSEFVDQKLQEKISNLNNLQKEYALIQNDLPFILSAIPKKPTVPPLIGQLQSIAKSNNLKITRIQAFQVELPKANQTGQKQSSYAFSLDATGNYQDIANFTQKLTEFDRIITIDTIALGKGQDVNGIPKLTLRGKAYFKL